METTTEKEPSDVLTPDTENATYFKPNENNDRHERFQRFRLLNRGTWENRREENKEVKYRADNLAILDCLAGQLELTPYQKKESRRFFDTLNFRSIGKPVSLIAFGVCAVIANEDVHDGTRYWPTSNDTDDLFERIAGRLDIDEHQAMSIIGKVKHKRNQ